MLVDILVTAEIEASEVISFCASSSTESNIFKNKQGEKYCLLPDILLPSKESMTCNIGLLNVIKKSISVAVTLKVYFAYKFGGFTCK
jgi:hypothetical protein